MARGSDAGGLCAARLWNELLIDLTTAGPYLFIMRYTWDPEKDALNQRKHGYSLAQGVPALEDAKKVAWFDDRFDYGEERILTIGLNQLNVLFVVSVERVEEVTRIISVRKAKKDEERIYFCTD
ncbi:MAG: BrnT family toxin [Terracidiphilus sp.]